MAGIVFKEHADLPSAQVLRLYEDAGWTNYTNDPGKLMRALDGSLGVISVWDGDTLVGLARVVGDGETILYVQDILLLRDYQRRGLGLRLLTEVFDRYPSVRQKVLIADGTPELRAFYVACGLKPINELDCMAYCRFDV
ncbi:MAG: GNAT family N-acetyltransferase [Bifidobacterium scardovii]|uniref:GNAT family N-acetyltransferase n=1 Tax=Bifidobacterium scardovii TaxID=158787 RepID=UPI000666A137|nr:GNAT family N-acetyltransferase [Bifidobacterium scardovii]MBS6947885.1 GNAT family N-acetyltransferase [Bifidobacterium scardovii]MDU3736195.1 GNAT family N-acetyltransferase [Bifidobacterium scardovii]MDU5297202.1 GNAT family N-acetyltransferase [Bifidobacterium scardovii]MDU5611602.1 GNAT family N-acetyltransferase [Bifidobacterium scardovii]MDU5887293.1 GNAT family N-acetyltransferase [Bifidobacterium scardovii]